MPDIWECNDGVKRVHLRYLEKVAEQRTMLQIEPSLHLQPLPQKVPIKNFSKTCIKLGLCDNQVDMLVFSEIMKLYGIKSEFADGVTTHLVMMSQDNLHKSKSLQVIKKWKKAPKVVNSDWLFDSLQRGEEQDESLYKI